MKNYFFTLDNGLQVLIVQDKNKKNGFAELITKFGSKTEGFIYQGEKHSISLGLAHLLEHAIIEESPLGNAANYFKARYVKFNGATGNDYTRFYISDILDFENNLVKLIQVVNQPCFSEECLKEIKKPVIEEIRSYEDRLFLDISKTCYESLHHFHHRWNHCGSIEEVENISIEELNLVHRIFYQPKNQFLKISYAGDLDKIKQLIIDTYQKMEREPVLYEEIVLMEPLSVYQKKKVIPAKGKEELVYVLFKIPTGDFTPKELVRLSFYISYFLKENFSDGSHIYKEFIEKKYTIYSLEKSFDFEKHFMILTIGVFSSFLEEIKIAILKCFQQIHVNEETFELWKKETMIDLLLREEDPLNYLHPYADNILTFHYEKPDTLLDAESFSVEEYRDFLNRLDFSEYAVVGRIEEEKHE